MSSSRKIQRIFVLFLSLLYLIVYHFNLVFNQTESLVVGGHFSTITHLYNLLSWNNGDWAEIGDGLQSANNYNEVLCLDESRYGLVIGGDFRSVLQIFSFSLSFSSENSHINQSNYLLSFVQFGWITECRTLQWFKFCPMGKNWW